MNIVVTGSSRGIGLEMVRQLAVEKNHSILAVSRGNITIGTSAEGSRIIHAPIDMSDPIAIGIQLPPFLDQLGTIDVLINNAGLLINRSFMEQSPSDWLETFKVNLLGPVALIKLAVPFMKPGSHIVNIGSMGGFQGSAKFGGLSSYSASKAALANLTEMLAVELADKGIAVNCLALGSVDTEMLRNAFPGYISPVTPAIMADYIISFSRTAHKLMNGKVIPVALSTP